MTLTANEDDVTFQFTSDPSKQWASLTDRETTELLTKWGVDPRQGAFAFYQFQFDRPFTRSHIHDFLRSLFNSDAFRAEFRLGDGRGGTSTFWGPSVVRQVDYSSLTSTSTNLDLLDDTICNDDIVRKETGRISGMADVYLPGGVTVGDRLRGLFMLDPEEHPQLSHPEDYDAVTPEVRNEFLWHVLWRVVAGGAMNQWDDNFSVYKNVVRDLYRDMISVARDPNTGELAVQSVALQVHAAKGSDMDVHLFPREEDDPHRNHSFFYVIVHPARRSCTVWYNSFWSPF